jgi:Tol biopolymer transport system component
VRHHRVLVSAVLACAVFPGTSGAATIYFTSNRAGDAPGVIESLAPGTAPRALNRPPYGEHLLAVAPRGDTIAFTSDRAVGSLILSRADGSRRRTVHLGTSTPFGATFSPDGTTLAVSWGVQVRTALVDARSGHVSVLGADARQCQGDAAWSVDGRLLACNVTGRRLRVLVFDTAGRARFTVTGGQPRWSARNLLALRAGRSTHVVDLRGHLVHVFAATFLDWSPDGRTLALTGPGLLTLADGLTGRTLRTVRGPKTWQPFSAAGFTRDGSGYAYQGPHGALLLEIRGGAPRRLPAGVFDGHWSPDGRRLAWLRVSHGNATVEVGGSLGVHARPAGTFPFDGHADATLAWPETGIRVLYSWSHRTHQDLWRVDTDGGGLQQLTRTDDVSGLAFSRDGTRLAYARAGFEDDLCGYCDKHVVIADPQGRRVATVPPPDTGDAEADPTWAPDGTRLAVEHGFGGELDVVTLPGGTRTVLAQNGFAPAWSPDGGTVAWLDSRGVEGAAPDGSAHRTLLRLTGDVPGFSWSPDGRSVAYATPNGVYVAPLDGSSPPRLVVHAKEAGRPSFSADGTQLTFAARAGDPRLRAGDVFVVNLDGTGLHKVAASPFDDEDPVFGP